MNGRLLPAVLAAAAALIAALPSMAQADHGTSPGPWPMYKATGLAKDEPRIVAVAEDPPHPAGGAPGEHGKALFAQYGAACHGQHGEGGVGPALTGEAAKKDTAQAADFIKNPKAPMPKLCPAPLSDHDVADVAAFVETLK
jgi:mono/diheme cytochrome c family protein